MAGCPSGRPRSNDDALSRRDMVLEFLDVTRQVNASRMSTSSKSGQFQEDYTLSNISSSIVDTHLLIVVRDLSDDIELQNASGRTSSGHPYIRVFLPAGVLAPGQSIVQTLLFRSQTGRPPVGYTLSLLSGQGNP